MKTIRSSKTVKFDVIPEHEVYLEINVASVGNCRTNVSVQGQGTFIYNGRVKLGNFDTLRDKTIEMEHIFSFSSAPKVNLDDALKQTRITYSLISVLGPFKPFRNKTSADLIGDLIGTVKTIKIE